MDTRPTPASRWAAAGAALIASLALVTIAFAPPAGAARQRDEQPVTSIEDGSTEGISTLRRTSRGVRSVIRTSDLERGHAHTVWAVVFNHPEACDGPCDGPDLSNPDVGGASVRLTGRVVPAPRATFAGELRTGDALTNPRGAEIHLIVRTHGPVIRGLRHEQITTLNGGCPPNTCANVQVAIHLP